MTNDGFPAKDGFDAYFELSFSPNSALIPTVRRFVSDFYDRVLGDPDLTSRVVLAAHELLENAVTYSIDGQTSMAIGIRKKGRTIDVAIETKNRCTDAHVKDLGDRIKEIAEAEDPTAHYLLLMRRTSTRTDGSGLGLGRVRAEADMTIAYQIDGDVIRMNAQARYELPG